METEEKTLIISAEEYKALHAKIGEQETLIKYYESQLLSARRHRFGSRSEKTDIDLAQLTLFVNETLTTVPEAETEEITYRRKKAKGKREADLADLEVERIDYELNEEERACNQCGETMRDIGIQIRRELKLIPAKVIVVEHAIHTYSCRKCERENITVPFRRSKAPKPLISGSLASPSLVAHIAVQKYFNGMPLYRLENGFRYDGVNISRQTMANWVISCSERYLEGIYELLKTHLLRETVIHADETWIQVLREPGRAPQSKSYEWIYRTSGCSKRNIAIYEYKETRNGEHPKAFLKDFKGLLHVDGYHVYHNLPTDITIIGCWSHARRYFENILKKQSHEQRKGSSAERGVAYINALFKLEREFADLSPEERLQKRLEKSKPVSDAFFEWAFGLGALPKVPLGEATGYALKQRKYLENVFVDGRTELSNNRSERSVKPFVMGRKAWLFSTSPAGARASSVLYSIIETAKENGLHPFRYLEFLLHILPNATSSDLENLLPWSDCLPKECYVPIKKENADNGQKRA